MVTSKESNKDRDTFFRTQVLFWLLAAIDGHAKNYSIFIKAGGQYRLTPLYDIISAYPLISNGQLQTQKIKMAMALRGKNNHYHWYAMQRRYFPETARSAHYPAERAEQILDEMLEKVDGVIETISAQLPTKFPSKISQPIFEGMLLAKKRLLV